MNATVELFFKTLSQKLPDYEKHLNPPCDPKKFAEIETLIGEKLPEAMKDFYSICDGEDTSYDEKGNSTGIYPLRLALGWRFMALSEMKNEYNFCVEHIIVDNDEDYSFTNNSLEVPINGHLIKPVGFHRKWLPIVNDDCGGNYFSMDFAPQEKGTKGQIMMHSTSGDEGAYYDLATSFEDLLKQITKYLHEDKLYFEEDDSRLALMFDFRKNCQNDLPITEKQEQIFVNLTPKWKAYFESNLPRYGEKEFTLLWLQQWREIYQLSNDTIENDLSPLLLCPRMTFINLWQERGNYSIDILPELLQLISLGIRDVNQKDIEVIGNIFSLWSLNTSTKDVTDFSPLAKLSNLHILTISSDEEIDFSHLNGLNELRTLSVSSDKKIDFSHLNGLNKLRTLSVSSDKKIDFSHLAGLNELRTLSVSSLAELDLTSLQYLPKLTLLNNFVYSDLSVLSPLKQLKELVLVRPHNYMQPDDRRSYYENWETIKELKNLRTLNVYNSNFTDLSLVVDLPKLEVLNISQCEIADFSFLTSIKQKMLLHITIDQFFEAHSYLDKEKFTLHYLLSWGRTDEEKAFLEKWFAK